MQRTRLSINVNKIATIRNARGGLLPCPVEAARSLCRWGVDGVTVHPRPDQRHITFEDVRAIRQVTAEAGVEFNVEGYPGTAFMQLIEAVRPEQVTLVPDPPEALTSNAGWDTLGRSALLSEVLTQVHAWGMRSSLFVGTEIELIEGAAALGAGRVELYTEAYASGFALDREQAVAPFAAAAKHANTLGLGVNAGHDLNLENLAFFDDLIPELLEVSIGHAFISDALYLGMHQALQQYTSCLTTP
jgi:pyridoxine 5-phosphate synthase